MALFQGLEAKINQVFGDREAFAKAMGMRSSTVDSRMENKTEFTILEIKKAGQLLNLSGREVDELFFGIK